MSPVSTAGHLTFTDNADIKFIPMAENREWISFRVKGLEYDKIRSLMKKTSCMSMSEYARQVLLNKPVIVKYRNESAENFLAEMVLLRNELSAIGNNFNQAVKRLHTLDTVSQMTSWLIIYESTHKSFLGKIEEIKDRLVEIYDLWSQE